MKIMTVLENINCKLSVFLGINEEGAKTRPIDVQFYENDILIFGKEPFRRHRIVNKWRSFEKNDLKFISLNGKKKLGVAIGASIGKDLVVAFEDIDVINQKSKGSLC